MSVGAKPMRAPSFAHMSFSGDFGGREKVAASLQRATYQSGYTCWLYMIVEERVGATGNANLLRLLGDDVEYRRFFRTSSRFSFRLLKELQRNLFEDGVRIVHCHCYKSLFYVLLLRNFGLIDVSVVYTLHGLVLQPGWSSTMVQAVQHIGLRLCDGVVGCSEEILRANVPPSIKGRSIAIINAIESVYDYEALAVARPAARLALAERFGLHADKPVVVNVGRLCPQKNYPLYFRLIARDLQRNAGESSAHYLLVGTGKLEQSLKSEARRLGVEKHVIFTGFIPDMERVFAGADLLVQTSIWEGTPMCLLEAQSFGLPTVVPDVGGNGAVVADGVNGYLYPVGELDVFAARVDAYLADGSMRERHGRAAHDNVRTRFNTENWVRQHVEFYKRIEPLFPAEKMTWR